MRKLIATSQLAVIFSLVTLASVRPAHAQSVAELTAARQSAREAVAAYRTQDWRTYEERLSAALRVQPHHPVWLYNLACAAALGGDAVRALALLDTVAKLGFAFDAAADDDFASLRGTVEFEQRVARLAANRQRVGESTVAVTLPQPAFLPEGVAYDARTGTLFVSSVHERKIVRVRGDVVETVVDSSAGLWSVLGIAFAPATESLWAVTTIVPEMAGYAPDMKGTALVELDARTGAVRRRIEPPGDGHSFNDLTVDDERRAVYVADPGVGAVYEWTEQQGLRELVPPGIIYSPSGLAIMPATEWLYVADYPVGLVRVSTRTGEMQRLAHAEGVSTYGTDGLMRHGKDLIVIQNGAQPHRVARLVLSGDGARIERLIVLARASPYFDEPTLGVIAADVLFYVANSRWGKFRDGRYVGATDAGGPVILKLPL
jgi:sugar lactone lactonase YvrE